jgi:hypothetical protein
LMYMMFPIPNGQSTSKTASPSCLVVIPQIESTSPTRIGRCRRLMTAAHLVARAQCQCSTFRHGRLLVCRGFMTHRELVYVITRRAHSRRRGSTGRQSGGSTMTAPKSPDTSCEEGIPPCAVASLLWSRFGHCVPFR